MMKPILNDAELDRIRQAVSEAEMVTSGEIVPCIVASCGTYEVARWRAAGVAALVTLMTLALLTRFYGGWEAQWWREAAIQTLAIALAGALAAGLATYVPPVKRLFAGRTRLMRRVHQRAMATFVEQEVFNTRERTGILLFVSLFEHWIEVIGDSGINAKVTQNEWAEVVTRIRSGIKEGRLAEGMVQGITLCGELLQRLGVERREDDVNELPDDVQLG